MTVGSLFSASIGLVVVYYVFSYLVSTVAGQIEIIADLRARNLEQELRKLFNDDSTFNKFKKHPLYTSLKPATRRGFMFFKPIGGSSEVSNIPSSTFAMTLFDVVIPDDQSKTVAALEAGINNLPANTALKDDLLGLLDSTTSELKVTRGLVETWYDSQMEKVSALYRRYMKIIVIVLSLMVTLIFNVDTIELVDSLLASPVLQNLLVEQADIILDASTPAKAQEQVDTLISLDVPLGWNVSDLPATPIARFWKVVGLLVTWAALSQGAPFWYNILKQLRSQGSSGQSSSA